MALSDIIERARAASGRALRVMRGQAKNDPVLPPSPFEDWTYVRAEEAINRALDAQTIDVSANATRIGPAPGEASYPSPRSRQDPIATNRLFYQGDHWQNGAGWVGPHPANGENGFTDVMNEIALTFVSKNVVREVVDRHALGIVGKAYQWAFVPRREIGDDQEPTKDEQAAIDAATSLMRNWLKARKADSLVRDAVCTMLLAERASVRVFVPPGLADDVDGQLIVRAKTIEDALSKVWLEHLKPEDAAIACDDNTKLECGVWLYDVVDDDGDDDTAAQDRERYVGLCYLDEHAQTVTKTIPQSDDSDDTEKTATLDLGGRLAIFEMRRNALVTTQVQQSQRALNLAETMIPRNVVSGGFLERIILDAQLPGKPELDGDGNETGRWIEAPFYVGANTTNVLVGAEYQDEEGKTKRSTPSVVYREPVKPDASIAASDKHYRAILEDTDQLHALIAGDATASAISRITARIGFLNSLMRTQPEVEALLGFILETALAMAEALSQKVGEYTKVVRSQVRCTIDTGPITPEERAAIEASIGKTISQRTAMVMLGVEDVDAELTRIQSDPLARAALGEKIGEALQSLTLAGATLDGAAAFIGIEDEDLQALLTPSSFAPEPTQFDAQGNPIAQPPGAPGSPPGTAPAKNGGKPGAPGNGVKRLGPRHSPGVRAPAPGAKGARQGSGSGSATGGASSV